MSIRDVVNLIQANSSSRKNNTLPKYKTEFGVQGIMTIDEENFSNVYSSLIGYIYKNLKLMKKAISSGEETCDKFGLPFQEKALNDTLPFILDFLFQFDSTDGLNDFFNTQSIASLVSKTQHNIIALCNFPEDSQDLVCYVLKSEVWCHEGDDFQRLKLVFPGTRINKDIFNGCFLTNLIADLKSSDVFRLLEKTPLNADWDKIISKAGDYYTMYGCKNKEYECPAVLYKIYNDEPIPEDMTDYRDDDDEQYIIPFKECDVFDPLDGIYFTSNLLDKHDYKKINYKKSLPIILSVNYQNKITKYNPNILRLEPNKKSKSNKVYEQGFNGKMKEEDAYNSLITLINPTRFETKHYWYTIGRVTYNVFNGSKRGLEKFKELTPEVFREEAKSYWYSLSKNHLNTLTLMEFARQDNQMAYNEWNKEQYKHLIERCITSKGKDIPMAELAKRLLCLDYIYCRKDKLWYRKSRAILKQDFENLWLKEELEIYLKEIFYEEHGERCKIRDDAKGIEERKVLQARIKDVENVIDNLDKGSYIDSIIKSLRGKLFDDNFFKYKDEDLNLLGCENYILEIHDKDICYRPGKLQDFVTKSTEIEFPDDKSHVESGLRFLEEYYGQVHTDPEMKHFFMKDMASYLQGGNPEKYFRNFIGERNASKSKVIELLQKAMGEYCVDLPASLITLNKNKISGGPCPELEQARGARICVVSETGKSMPLSVHAIKQYTGNDRYWTRTLNKEGSSRSLTFKLIHMSNVIASVPDADKGYRCREVIYPFKSQWVVKAPKTIEEQYRKRKFKMDTKFSEKIKNLGRAQLYLMYMYFPVYKKEGLKRLPEIMKEETKKHHREIDPFYMFTSEKIDRFYDFPNNETKNRLRKKKKRNRDGSDDDEDSQSDNESEYESDYEDEIEDSDDDEDEEDIEQRRKELSKYLDKEKKTHVNDVFNSYTRWYTKFCPDTVLNLTQSEFTKEMTRDDRLGPIKKSYWLGLELRKKKATRH